MQERMKAGSHVGDAWDRIAACMRLPNQGAVPSTCTCLIWKLPACTCLIRELFHMHLPNQGAACTHLPNQGAVPHARLPRPKRDEVPTWIPSPSQGSAPRSRPARSLVKQRNRQSIPQAIPQDPRACLAMI